MQVGNAELHNSAEQETRWKRFQAIFRSRTYQKGDHIVSPLSNRYQLLFVERGLLRFFYVSAQGAESNKAFIAEGQFAAPLAAARLGEPILFGVQALEDSLVLEAPWRDFEELCEQDLHFERIARHLATSILIGKEIRQKSLLQDDAAKRYEEFVLRFPELYQRIPQYHIASYLGITEVSLSRLRKQFSLKRS